MEPTNELVYIVDNEANVGEALSTLLGANGKHLQVFTSGQDFLPLLAKSPSWAHHAKDGGRLFATLVKLAGKLKLGRRADLMGTSNIVSSNNQ